MFDLERGSLHTQENKTLSYGFVCDHWHIYKQGGKGTGDMQANWIALVPGEGKRVGA